MWSIKVSKSFFTWECVLITSITGLWTRPADSLRVVPSCTLKRRSELTSQEVEVTQKQRSHVWLPVLLVPDVGNDEHFYLSDLLKGLKWPRFPLYICCRGTFQRLMVTSLAGVLNIPLPLTRRDVSQEIPGNVENSWGIFALCWFSAGLMACDGPASGPGQRLCVKTNLISFNLLIIGCFCAALMVGWTPSPHF